MSAHVVSYDENSSGSKSRAKCTCGEVSRWHDGGAERTWAKLDAWAEAHIDESGRITLEAALLGLMAVGVLGFVVCLAWLGMTT